MTAAARQCILKRAPDGPARRIALLSLGPAVVATTLGSCAWVDFELSPYAPRHVIAVYSSQEDLTFLFWRTGRWIAPNQVTFELALGEEYEPLDLASAPYPAEPFQCGTQDELLCFQYQLQGRYAPPAEGAALRARHEHNGLFPGDALQASTMDVTLKIEPVGILNNAAIEPNTRELLHSKGLPLRRSYQWRLTHRHESTCLAPYTSWSAMAASYQVGREWIEETLCYELRPVRRDREGIVLRWVLLPSAQTFPLEQEFTPESVGSPTVYAILMDLRIPDLARCNQTIDTLAALINATFATRGEAVSTGVFFPQGGSTTGGSRCEQALHRRYPAPELMDALLGEVSARSPQPVRPMLIYVNNIDLPLPEDLKEDIQTLIFGLEQWERSFVWSISTGSASLGRDMHTAWEPVKTPRFAAAVRSFADTFLPFMTLLHKPDTPVPLRQPDLPDARAVKVCRASPTRIIGVQSEPLGVFAAPTDGAALWEERGDGFPAAYINLGAAHLVPWSEFRLPEVIFRLEFCERFCEHPFRAAGGQVHSSWMVSEGTYPMEACEWF